MQKLSRTKQLAASGALVLAGLGVGVAVGTTGSASAADTSGTSSSTSSTTDQSKSQRSDETLLTGTTADKVKAAALAKYPGATVQRAETDSDGVYEAHLVTSAGKRVTVEVGKDFSVTGEESMGAPGGDGGPSGQGRPGGSGGPGGPPAGGGE